MLEINKKSCIILYDIAVSTCVVEWIERIFVDGNKQNVVLDNLRLIERGTHAVMNHEGLCNYEGEFKDTAIAIAALKRQTSVRKKK